MAGTLVRLEGVAKEYGAGYFALKDVSFSLSLGEFVYVTGKNGAGKTTLLKLLFGLERPTEGSIFINNRDISLLSVKKIIEHRRQVGFIFQDFKLLDDVTVFENICVPLEIRKMSYSDMTYRVCGVLGLVGLSGRENDYPRNLSGGERQRVAIARAIITKPLLLLADEPTGNLDEETAREIMPLFREIREMGTTIIIATHDKGLISSFPGRVIFLEKGRVIET